MFTGPNVAAVRPRVLERNGPSTIDPVEPANTVIYRIESCSGDESGQCGEPLGSWLNPSTGVADPEARVREA